MTNTHMEVEPKTFSSNNTKLLKHLDKLKLIQDNKPPSPIIAHVALINACNLTCSFCCFANRDLSHKLDIEQIKKALRSFKKIGITGIEFTGGGEPTLHPDFHEIAKYASNLGFKLGLCTNGKLLGSKIKKETVQLFSWIRIGLYGFHEGYSYDLKVFEGTNTKISAAYIWDQSIETSSNPNVKGGWTNAKSRKLSQKFQTKEDFIKMINWVEANKIPTRIAFNAIKPVKELEKDIDTIKSILKNFDLKYAFFSEFNFKGNRKNDHCYMHMIKPFLFTDGYIYACPAAELSLENNHNYVPESQFMICNIDNIEEFYSKPASLRHHACSYCKYAMQNELIDDIVRKTEHNEFA